MKFISDNPYKLFDLLSYLLIFVATGTSLAVAQNDTWYYGSFGGLLAGLALCLPVFIVVNLIHYIRRRKSR